MSVYITWGKYQFKAIKKNLKYKNNPVLFNIYCIL